ncbi:hypothetical protein [Rhodosalinus sp. FB01]|uniref:hypothetical protein n=1 Tax=Rhodosalinus sp. FB01 TaxID=3239194 RepID=UPI003524CAD1
MRPPRYLAFSATAVAGLAAGLALAQEDDIFSFIPDGGRTLLAGLLDGNAPEGLARAVATEDADEDAWMARLGDTDLDQWQTETLAQYLAARAPFDPGGEMPRDGRDLALALCQSCHIITVTVTQDRTVEAWLGTMNSPSHIEIEMTEADRRLLAEYLVVNAGIPIDLIPRELRAGGASY